MKTLIILALVTLAAADWKAKSRDELREVRRNCMKDLNMSQDMKDKANRLEYPDNDVMKQYILCGARGSELWMDSKGWMIDRVMLMLKNENSMSMEEMKAILDGCMDNNSQGSSLEDWVYRTHKCVMTSEMRDAFIRLMKKVE